MNLQRKLLSRPETGHHRVVSGRDFHGYALADRLADYYRKQGCSSERDLTNERTSVVNFPGESSYRY